MPTLPTDGATLYYETAGDPLAPALLLIHAGVATLRMWDPQVDLLASDHHVIRYDTRGFGRSRIKNRKAKFAEHDDALRVLEHFEIEQATIIGCSRGGSIALDLAVEHPDRVRGVVAVGTGLSGYPELALSHHEEELFDQIAAAELAGEWEKALRLEVELWVFGPLRDPATLDPAFVERAYELAMDNLKHAASTHRPQPIDPLAFARVRNLAVPALFMVGEFDITETLVYFDYLCHTVPGAESHRFAEAAHLPSVEQPDEFERVLHSWLNRHEL
jgi:3-oxoadipate enol-lactonase